jgi:hypothetical protein
VDPNIQHDPIHVETKINNRKQLHETYSCTNKNKQQEATATTTTTTTTNTIQHRKQIILSFYFAQKN